MFVSGIFLAGASALFGALIGVFDLIGIGALLVVGSTVLGLVVGAITDVVGLAREARGAPSWKRLRRFLGRTFSYVGALLGVGLWILGDHYGIVFLILWGLPIGLVGLLAGLAVGEWGQEEGQMSLP